MGSSTLRSFLQSVNLKENVDLKKMSTMKTGGIASHCVFPTTQDELTGTVRVLRNRSIKYSIVGNASNLLFLDKGYKDRILIFTTEMKSTEIRGQTVYADCGVSLTALAMKLSKEGLIGMEFAYGIPGTIGGAIYMNAGAYGGQMSDLAMITKVYIPEDDKFITLIGDEHEFGYRTSVFEKENGSKVIVSTILRLNLGDVAESLALCEQNMSKRKAKQPLKFPSCGSAFKRPSGQYAGDLIERSGLKGFSVGGAAISNIHAGFIVNNGSATTDDVLKLIDAVTDIVYKNFRIQLEPEIKVLR